MAIFSSGKHRMVFGSEVRGLQGLYYKMCRYEGKAFVGQWKGAQIGSFIRLSSRVGPEIQRIGRGRFRRFIRKDLPHHANTGFDMGKKLFPWPGSIRKKVVQGVKIPFTFISLGSSIRTWSSIRTPIALR